jgi:hypothetical protein
MGITTGSLSPSYREIDAKYGCNSRNSRNSKRQSTKLVALTIVGLSFLTSCLQLGTDNQQSEFSWMKRTPQERRWHNSRYRFRGRRRNSIRGLPSTPFDQYIIVRRIKIEKHIHGRDTFYIYIQHRLRGIPKLPVEEDQTLT